MNIFVRTMLCAPPAVSEKYLRLVVASASAFKETIGRSRNELKKEYFLTDGT